MALSTSRDTMAYVRAALTTPLPVFMVSLLRQEQETPLSLALIKKLRAYLGYEIFRYVEVQTNQGAGAEDRPNLMMEFVAVEICDQILDGYSLADQRTETEWEDLVSEAADQVAVALEMGEITMPMIGIATDLWIEVLEGLSTTRTLGSMKVAWARFGRGDPTGMVSRDPAELSTAEARRLVATLREDIASAFKALTGQEDLPADTLTISLVRAILDLKDYDVETAPPGEVEGTIAWSFSLLYQLIRALELLFHLDEE
ncbi:MAG: hypothetical protein A3J66_00445 [Candidatus Magasanikbacteria bacterium RIFCSPHIGHO2_02_FULL_47_14]|uniref:Uncharacterized protein n=1 Tax=Candidatus Magasanikbacteria bacterium RIFCSPHIGHO2_02_FULL_47_14 TaxID=1798680 RepID=A0A1F6MBF1_9BACT|nr:MAG: hypothetical protein A3J66_00445 [Candidatus Magasanikbacteria bacterium RIFCSPHIGHO2_02_FULL_47_14]